MLCLPAFTGDYISVRNSPLEQTTTALRGHGSNTANMASKRWTMPREKEAQFYSDCASTMNRQYWINFTFEIREALKVYHADVHEARKNRQAVIREATAYYHSKAFEGKMTPETVITSNSAIDEATNTYITKMKEAKLNYHYTVEAADTIYQISVCGSNDVTAAVIDGYNKIEPGKKMRDGIKRRLHQIWTKYYSGVDESVRDSKSDVEEEVTWKVNQYMSYGKAHQHIVGNERPQTPKALQQDTTTMASIHDTAEAIVTEKVNQHIVSLERPQTPEVPRQDTTTMASVNETAETTVTENVNHGRDAVNNQQQPTQQQPRSLNNETKTPKSCHAKKQQQQSRKDDSDSDWEQINASSSFYFLLPPWDLPNADTSYQKQDSDYCDPETEQGELTKPPTPSEKSWW
ncbi:hypothetical protein QBC44DRAFT_390597 [Cladorrhinum sp. PSN332]|nr:hypothetical protein QBC44DRAFT_390597 [Cladorrhinum sp. PSN332]